MHDPMVVAFDIRLPIPKREKWRDQFETRRWTLGRSRRTNPENLGDPTYPWWNLRGYRPVIAGRTYGWHNFLTIWHVEPGGRDSGEVCKHSRRWQDETGKWHSERDNSWRWHVRHWRIQFHQWQKFRRWVFTRCEWCGGRSRKGDYVNCSHQWDREPGPWWRGERGLFHQDCSSIETAHRQCACGPDGLSDPRPGIYRCLKCEKWRREDAATDRSPSVATNRLYQSIPVGGRDMSKTEQARAMWKAYRHATGEEDAG